MPGTVKSELLPDADRSHKCDCQEKVSWKRNLPLDKSHFITEMEEHSKRAHNPEPYYYVKVLEYLSWKDGSGQAFENVRSLDARISRLDSDHRFDQRRGRLDKIRDLFVVGKEMGQLMDVTAYHGETEILNALNDSQLQPQVFEGHLDEFVYQHGVLRLYQPSYWNNEKAWLETGKQVENTVSSRQLNHNIIFIGGFSVDRLRALPNSARDKSAGEYFDVSNILKVARKKQIQSLAKLTESAQSQHVTASTEEMGEPLPKGMDAVKIILPTSEKTKSVPIRAGEVVDMNVTAVTNSSVEGEFEKDGVYYRAYVGRLNASKRKQAEKAYKTKTKLKVRVQGGPKNSVYQVMMV